MRVNIAHLSLMEEAMEDDPDVVVNPWDTGFQLKKDQLPKIPLTHRSVWEPEDLEEDSDGDSERSLVKKKKAGKWSTSGAVQGNASQKKQGAATVSAQEETIPSTAEKVTITSQEQTPPIAPTVNLMDVDAVPTPSTPPRTLRTYSR